MMLAGIKVSKTARARAVRVMSVDEARKDGHGKHIPRTVQAYPAMKMSFSAIKGNTMPPIHKL